MHAAATAAAARSGTRTSIIDRQHIITFVLSARLRDVHGVMWLLKKKRPRTRAKSSVTTLADELNPQYLL
jgi:hypothetical protein